MRLCEKKQIIQFANKEYITQTDNWGKKKKIQKRMNYLKNLKIETEYLLIATQNNAKMTISKDNRQDTK